MSDPRVEAAAEKLHRIATVQGHDCTPGCRATSNAGAEMILAAADAADPVRARLAEVEAERDRLWTILGELDRCEHRRHEGDICHGCGGPSSGNPHMDPRDRTIGYSIRGRVVVPERGEKHDSTRWLAPDHQSDTEEHEVPVESIPSHASTDDYVYIKIDRLSYRVERGVIRTGNEIRAFAHPPIANDKDLWLERPGEEDLLIGDHMGVRIHGGLRFWTAPKFINAGSSDTEEGGA